MVMKYLEGIIRERALTSKEDDGSVSREKRSETTFDEVSNELRLNRKSDHEKMTGRSKFKKVKTPVFNGTDLDSWLF